MLLLDETTVEAMVAMVVTAADVVVVITLEDDILDRGDAEPDDAETAGEVGLRQLSLLGVIRSSLAFSGWLSLLWSSLGEHTDEVVTSLRPLVELSGLGEDVAMEEAAAAAASFLASS